MKIPGKLSAVLFSVWSLCAYAAEPENPADRYFLAGSSDREGGAGAVALVDRVSLELIIFSAGVGDPSLREVVRHDYDPSIIDLTTIRVPGNRNLVVVSYSSEPIGNRTTEVIVYDPTANATIFVGYSPSPATVRDVTGDEQEELILYVDNQGFEIPYAPNVPVVYSFDGETFVRNHHGRRCQIEKVQRRGEATVHSVSFQASIRMPEISRRLPQVVSRGNRDGFKGNCRFREIRKIDCARSG